MSFDKLDKVVIVEIGKFLTLYNDYVSLLLTCKKIARILSSTPRKDVNIYLSYKCRTHFSCKNTVFLHIYRSWEESASVVLYWRGKYSSGWYDRSGMGKRIDIICPVNFPRDTQSIPYIYDYHDTKTATWLDKDDPLKLKIDRQAVIFYSKTSLQNFLDELKYIERHKKEIEFRWDYKRDIEIKI